MTTKQITNILERHKSGALSSDLAARKIQNMAAKQESYWIGFAVFVALCALGLSFLCLVNFKPI